jgi:hypothetical protein
VKGGLLAVAGTRSRMPSAGDKQLLKVLLTVEFSFPCMRKCLEVIQKEQVCFYNIIVIIIIIAHIIIITIAL